MGQTPPKNFAPPLPFGASMASNVLQQSNPVAQVPQQSFINLQDPSLMQYPQQSQQNYQSTTQPPSSPFAFGGYRKYPNPDELQMMQ